ncbi:MAG: asparagine synthetase B [Bacteroidia bacterium]|nr:MAG: asparagine synthetase B [Bacteroidia bacterium]
MCGIAGILYFNNQKVNFQPEVLSTLKHRGPDGQGYKAFENAIFYHTRLSIIDLTSQSQQPYLLDDNKCLVFNGEIFNYKEIAKFVGIDNAFSDTIVLAKYFDKHRIDGLKELNGFFAFAFYDVLNNECFIVRDRFGEKPLYYFYDENVLTFASEIQPLLILLQKKLPIDYDVLYTYFRMHYIPGENSILKGIKRLLPGHYIHIKNNRVEVQKWYTLDNVVQNNDFEELLHTAVQRRLISDAPIGAFLSGGIDSSVVCAIAKQHKQDLHTFSLGFKDLKLYNETKDALIVAEYIKSVHHSFEISVDEVIQTLPSILDCIDEPFADSSAINVYFLSQKIKPFATVALSGDGSDELLMGYNKHKVFLLKFFPYLKFINLIVSPVFKFFPENRSSTFLNSIRKLKKFSYSSQLNSIAQYIYLSQWAEDSYIHQLFSIKLNNLYFYSLFEKYKTLNDVELFNRADTEIVLVNDMLYKIDFFGMQNAVEIRSPFLDHEVVEFLFHQPFKNKIHYTQQKYLLRKTFSHLLPSSIFEKKKKGFEIPLHSILPHFIKNSECLSEEYIKEQRLFNYSIIQKLIQQLPSNENDASLKLWAILVFQHWFRKFENFIEL